MLNNSSECSTGFNIGQDFAYYRLNKPETFSSEVIDGYFCKKDSEGSTRTANMFIKKWLNLRLHAYDRGLHFSEGLSIEKIKELYIASRGVCPITRISLTAATCEDSDWSIDRVINDYGYVSSNLIVMSKKANEAKGDLSLAAVKAIRDSKSNSRGLTHKEWCILFDLMWRTNDQHEVLSSNIYDELIGVREGADLAEFGLTLLSNITDPSSDMYELSLDFFAYESTRLPSSKQKKMMKAVKSLLKKRLITDPNVRLAQLEKRSPSTRKLIQSILMVTSFKSAYELYLKTKHECQESVREAKSVRRIDKTARLSFSQKGR